MLVFVVLNAARGRRFGSGTPLIIGAGVAGLAAEGDRDELVLASVAGPRVVVSGDHGAVGGGGETVGVLVRALDRQLDGEPSVGAAAGVGGGQALAVGRRVAGDPGGGSALALHVHSADAGAGGLGGAGVGGVAQGDVDALGRVVAGAGDGDPLAVGVEPAGLGDRQGQVGRVPGHRLRRGLGLRLRPLPERGCISVESDSLLLTDAVAERARAAAAKAGFRTQGILTYLANSIRAGDREVPYSLVSAIEEERKEPAAPNAAAPATLVLNDWAARDLGAKACDAISLDFYLWGGDGRLATSRAQFILKGVVPIQGAAADVIKIAMIAIRESLLSEGFRTRMILQVHDELVFETPESEVAGAEELIRGKMEGAAKTAVPLKVEIGHGKNWAEAHG